MLQRHRVVRSIVLSALLVPAITLASEWPIQVDGTISDDEWSAAERVSLTHGGELLWMRDGAHLYLGLRGTGPGWSHVYVSGDDTVHVLHASAALGAVRYEPDEGGLWQPQGEFTWELRGTDVGAEAQAAYLEANSWVASTARMGARNEQEFVVALDRLAGPEPRLAVVHAPMDDGGSRASGPGELADDTLHPDLLNGNSPQDLRFEPSGWARVEAPILPEP